MPFNKNVSVHVTLCQPPHLDALPRLFPVHPVLHVKAQVSGQLVHEGCAGSDDIAVPRRRPLGRYLRTATLRRITNVIRCMNMSTMRILAATPVRSVLVLIPVYAKPHDPRTTASCGRGGTLRMKAQ